jgi:hypothetical protein
MTASKSLPRPLLARATAWVVALLVIAGGICAAPAAAADKSDCPPGWVCL